MKIPKWILENLDMSLAILMKVKLGFGLSDRETREQGLTTLFTKLHKHGYIKGTFFIGFKIVKDCSHLTEKGKTLLLNIENLIQDQIAKRWG